MWNLLTGRSSESYEASPSGIRRRKDNDQRSAQRPSESLVSPKSAGKPPRGDDRDGSRRFKPTSTSYSSTSRSAYPGTASVSIASSYATASNGQTDDAVIHPDVVRDASLADQLPKSRPSHKDRDQDRAQERKSERRRSSSRDRKRDRDSKRWDRKGERDKVDKGGGMDRGLTRSGSGYAEEMSTPRTGETFAHASGSFNAQVGSSGFTQFPGQYDGGMPGFASGPPPLHESMSAHVQDQFPGQFPLESTAPYRPPLAASEGGPGLAADYYGDAGESVTSQPGVRPQPLGPIIGAEPHLQPASHIAQPPPEPSSAGGVGAAASFYSGVDLPSTLPSQPSMTSKPSKFSSSAGSAALAGSAVLGYTAGTTGEASYTQGSGNNGSAYYQQGSGRPPSSATGTAAYSSTSAPASNGYHASSAPVLPTLGAAAAGAAAGYMMGSHSSAQQQPSGHSGYSPSATQRPTQFGDHFIGTSVSSRPPRPAKYSPQSSSLSFHSAGQSNAMAQKHRHRAGPLGTFVEFWTDPDGVAQYEEYTEYIGVCKNCFAPGSTPRDAPRKHHYRRRRSDERYGSSTRVDKESRWGSSDGENRRRSRKSWLAGGIAGYGIAEVGKTLFNQKRGADDIYNVRFSRGNASNTLLRRRSGSDSPSRRSRTSYGVTGESSASISRRRSRSGEHVETGVTSDGKIYWKDPHGSLLRGPAIKTYTPRLRSRSRSRSRSRDRHNGHAAAALGATPGSTVVASQSRRRDRSSDKASVRFHHRSRERSPRRGEVSMLSGFFSSPPEKRQRSHRKKKRGFFSFGNSSSSSADADLAFGAGIEMSRDRKRLSTRSRNDRNADAAFLGLSAAAAAIALGESQKGSKSSRKADVVAVKETKSKKRVSSENRHRGKRTSASPIMEEDGWESASDEDDSSSVNSALAYGGHARRSQESLTSDSSGMGKWGWRWGSKKKSKRTVQAGSTADNFGTNAGTIAATLAGAIAGGAVASNTWQWQNDSRMSSSSNLPPLQQVYPVPTSDPSRFDVIRHDSIVSSNQPLMTSRPAPVPLQQPQPIVPVSHTVYTTQPPYSHSYSAPSGPPVFSQITYQPQPSNVGDSRDTSSGPTQTNVPGSFPGGGMVADNAPLDARTEFSHQRRETFPITKTVEPELDPLPRRQRASTRDESSAARFDFSEEPKGEDLYDWRRRQVNPDQRREEIQVQDAHQRRQVDHGSISSNGVSMRRTEYTSEPAGNMGRKGDYHLNRGEDESKRRKPDSRVVPVDTRMVGAAISAAASEVAHVGAETHQEERREDDRKDRIEKREDPADDEPRYSSGEGTGAPDSVEQHVQITPRVLSRSVKNPDHENYAAYFIPREFLSESNDGRQSTEVQGDNDVTTDQIPQIIAVEPKGSGLSFIPAHTHTDEVDLDHITLPWQVPRLNLIEPTPPHSIAGSTKGGTSPVIKPEDAIEETKETPGSSTTPKVTWGKDETHTYQVVTPLENPEEFISTSTMLHNEEEDIETSSEASPLDDSPIIVERVPRMPGDFGDDLEFAATVAAGLEDTGFDPAIVIDDATFRRRDSPPGSEATGFYRSPFAETIIDLGLDSPGTEGAPPQQGFVEGELPPTPKYEQGPNANGGNADVTALKPSKKASKSRKKVAEHNGDDDIPGAFDTKSELHDQRGVSDDPGRYSAQQERRVSVPVNVFDYLDEGSRVEDSKGKASEKSDDGLEITSSGSPGPADVARSEYFDAPEAAAEVLKSSSSSWGFDDVTVDVPAAEQPVGDFQEPNRADKRKKKSRKSEQDGQTFGSPAASPGSTALERNGDISSKRNSDRKSPRRDSERYSPSDRDLRSVMSDPVSEKDREEGKSRSRDSLDNNNLYDSPFEDARPTPAYAPIEDEFDEPRKSKKKSKRGSSGYGDISASVSPSAAVEDKRDSKSKSKKNKKGGLFGIFSASKSSDKLSETAQAQDAAAETTSDTYEEPKRKNKKSKERRSTRNGDDVSTQASDRLMEDVPVPALLEEVDVEGNPDDFEDANAKRKKSKDRKTNHTYGDWYGPADQSSSKLSRKENDDDGGKSRKEEYKRRSQESDLVEKSGRVTQALQAKVYKAASSGRFLIFMLNQVLMSPEDRDLPSIRKAPTINAPNVVDSNAGSGENEKIPFLEERQTTPPPPDIRIPADPHSHYAYKSVENFRPWKVEHETEASQFTGISGAPSTPPSAAFPLEDLPPLPASRPASPAPVSEDHMRRTSVIQASDSPQNHLVNSSPTAIPLHFRRPQASPGPARSSPSASPTTPNQRALDIVPPQRRSRPNSTEFKSSTEFRPLWLVERHGSRQEIAAVESYPSLPSSHTTSRSSSVHDPDEVGSHFYRDDGLSDSHAVSDGEDNGLRIDISRSIEREDLLGSRQATPTAASFHLDTKDNVLTEKMQDSGQAETSASREHSAKEAIRGVFPSSPKRLSHSVGGDLPERYVLSPIRFEALEDLPPLPTSRSSSPSLEGYVQETSATPEEAEKIEELPSLPASRSSFFLIGGLGRESSSILKEAEQLEGLPPLPVSRSSSPLHDIQGRKPTLTSEEAEQLEELPPLPASRSSSPLHDSQQREISSLSKEADHLKELPPLPASRSSSPLQDSQQRGIHSVSGEATQVEELPRLLVGRSSSPLHDSQIGGISSLSEKAEQLEELPPLPASRSSSPLHGSQHIGIRSEPEEVEQVEELSTLLLERSSSPLHDIQGRKATSASEEAEQLEKLPPLPVSRSSSPLHDSQLEPETAPSNKDAMIEAAEKFTFKKSKKDKKGKKKVLGQASSSYQDEGKAEVGVMSEIDKGPGKENTLEQSYFDRAIHPTEVQELSLPPQTMSEDLLEYAASVPLPLDEVGDKATDVVAVKRVQVSDVAWSRAVDVTESEVTPIDSSRSQQLSTSLPDAQSIADRSRELSALGIPDPTAIQTTPMIEITRTSTIEDDSTVLPTEKIGKKAKRQQRKQLEQERVDTAEYKPLPTSVLPEVPANKEELESSFPVNRTASEGRFSPETEAASRDALRELELEDGVSYFSLTSVESGKDDRKQSKYHGTAFADEGDQSAVHGGQPTNHEVLHTAPHESTLATIVEQPDYVDPVALGHDADSQLADQGASNQKNFSQLFVSTSKEVESNVGPMEFGTGSHSLEESELRGPHIDDAPVRENPQLLATTDSSIVYPPGDSLSIGHLASGSAPKSVAGEYMALPSNGNVFTSTTSRKSKKGKKGKKTQELLRDDDTAPPATPDPEEAPIENLEAPPLQPSFETPEPGTSHSYIENLPAEQREYEPSIEATLPTPRGYAALEQQLTADGADEDLGSSMKKMKKKAKKMKQQADLAQGIEEQPQLEKIAEQDAAASSVNPVGVEQQQLDKIDIPRKLQEPQESQQSDLHMLAQHVDPGLMAKDGEHTPVPIIELYQQTHSTIQDSLPSGIAQKPIPMADISEITKARQIEHEHATAHFDHPQEVTATNKENQDDSWDFPTTKKPKKSEKSKKQSPRLDIDTKPQEVQPESSVDPLHQHTSTISHGQPLSIRRPEVSKSASPPQVTGHGGDGQFVGAGALAAIGSGVAAALLHNKSEEKGTKSKNQGEDRQLIAHEVERMESPSLHDEVTQPSEGSLPLSNAIQHRIPAQSQLYDDTRSSLPQFPAENEQRQDIARPSVASFQCDDDAKRDSAVQMSDSPVISEGLQTYDVVRDSGYQGTESSPPVGTDPEFIDASGTKHHSEIVERPSTLARHEKAKTLEQIGGYEDNASYNAENPLNISIEVDPTYEVAISRHKTKRCSGRVKSNFQDGNFDKNVSPHTNSSRAMDLETPVQYFDESPQPSPADSATKDRSSVLFQSSPSTREERTNQPIQPDTLHAPHSKIDPIDMSPAYNDNRGNLSGPDMSPSMATHEGASILAARASSLAALSGLTDAHRDSPKSLFGGPVGINSDLPSVISPPRTPFSLENSGRRQLNTITEHSPEKSLHHKQARALSDIGSPERGTKSARRSVTPREISQRRVRSPTVTGTIEKSLISTDDVLARLSWPAVDEDKHSVDLERSRSRNTDRRPSSRHSNVSALVSDGVKQRESEHRSVSGASIRSGESINAIIRTPEQFRSVSALSNRSGTPPLRRVDTRSVSGDLRAASKRGEAAKPAESEAEAEPAPAPAPAPAFSLATPSSSTYDPVKDKGKSRVKEMADIYVSNPNHLYRDLITLKANVLVLTGRMG